MASSLQNHNQRGRFTSIGQDRLSKKVRGVRLPIDVDQFLDTMSSDERAHWLRKVITDAAHDELLSKE